MASVTPTIEIVLGDTKDVPLEFTQGDDDAPFVFASDDKLKVAVVKRAGGSELAAWDTDTAADLEITDLANGKATLHVKPADLSDPGIKSGETYVFGAIRQTVGGDVLHLIDDGVFLAKAAVAGAIP